MKNTNYNNKAINVLMNIIIFPGQIILSRNTQKKTLENATNNTNISTCYYPHNDEHDTMNPCIKF